MVSIECKVCQRKVSINDEICPTCGTTNPGINMDKYRYNVFAAYFLVMIVPILLVWGYIWGNLTSKLTSFPNLNFAITAIGFLASIIGIYLLPSFFFKRQNMSPLESAWAFWYYVFIGLRLLIWIAFALGIGYLIINWLFKK